MRLFYDTETSGLFKEGLPVGDPSQPRIAQLGLKLFDHSWNLTGHFTALIKPDGWSMEAEAESVHGISENRCARHGIPILAALTVLQGFSANSRIIVAHNNEFDRKLVMSELSKLGSDGMWWKRKAPAMACTMELSTPVCKIVGDFGYKWPSLQESYNHFYPDQDYETKHDADSDIDATVMVYKALTAMGIGPEGKA